MLESEYFTFNGKDSRDFGVSIINSNGGLYSDIFLPNRTIVESKIPYRNNPNFKRVERDQISLPLSLYLEKWSIWNNLRAIVNWLDTDEYMPFFFNNDPDKIYYVIFEGSSELIHNGAKDGYANVNIRTLYPFAQSREEGESLQVRDGVVSTLEVANLGDAIIRPRITLTKIGNGNIDILNSQNNERLVINNLLDGEVVIIDCENEIIHSSFQDTANRFLYSSHNDVWLNTNPQVYTNFMFTGNFDIDFRYNLVYKNETR